MLIELWEKLRGYDKWHTVSATAIDVRVVPGKSHLSEQSLSCKLAWTSPSGTMHKAEISAEEESALYQLNEGDVLEIRINPMRPDRFYLPQLLNSQAWALQRNLLKAILGLLIVTAFFLPDFLWIFGKK